MYNNKNPNPQRGREGRDPLPATLNSSKVICFSLIFIDFLYVFIDFHCFSIYFHWFSIYFHWFSKSLLIFYIFSLIFYTFSLNFYISIQKFFVSVNLTESEFLERFRARELPGVLPASVLPQGCVFSPDVFRLCKPNRKWVPGAISGSGASRCSPRGRSPPRVCFLLFSRS